MNEQQMLDEIIKELDERKTENIVAYKINDVSSVSDYIVIGTATSLPHANAIAEYLVDNMRAKQVKPFAVEGQGGSRWVCLDFGEIMVHVMCQQEREFYNLEAIWGSAPQVHP